MLSWSINNNSNNDNNNNIQNVYNQKHYNMQNVFSIIIVHTYIKADFVDGTVSLNMSCFVMIFIETLSNLTGALALA